MPRYRLYFINPAPRHVRDIAEFDGRDDADAIRQAHARSDGRAMELWRGEDVIIAIPPREDHGR
jgi:hypothetical protein